MIPVNTNTVLDIKNALASGRLFDTTKPPFEDFYGTAEDYANMRESQLILINPANRVSGYYKVGEEKPVVLKAHKNDIVQNFFPAALGMFAFSACRDKQGNPLLIHSDAQHRGDSIMDLKKDLGRWILFKDSIIFFRVVREDLKSPMNSTLNDQVGHSNRIKLFNKDLLYGTLLQSIYQEIAQYNKELANKYYQQIANAIYALSEEKLFSASGNPISYYQFHMLRGEVNKLINKQKGGARMRTILKGWNSEKKDELIQAILIVLTFQERLESRWLEVSTNKKGKVKRSINKDLKKILNSSLFFGSLLWDTLTGARIVKLYDEEIAVNIKNDATAFTKNVLRLNSDKDGSLEAAVLNKFGVSSRTKVVKRDRSNIIAEVEQALILKK